MVKRFELDLENITFYGAHIKTNLKTNLKSYVSTDNSDHIVKDDIHFIYLNTTYSVHIVVVLHE